MPRNSEPQLTSRYLLIDESDGDEFFADAERNEKRGELNEALTLCSARRPSNTTMIKNLAAMAQHS
jgi:hypothetical protein